MRQPMLVCVFPDDDNDYDDDDDNDDLARP